MNDSQYQLKYLKSIIIKHTFLNIVTMQQIYLIMPHLKVNAFLRH
jgi:hypothetical protein